METHQVFYGPDLEMELFYLFSCSIGQNRSQYQEQKQTDMKNTLLIFWKEVEICNTKMERRRKREGKKYQGRDKE